jgi:hypothetical protein
MGHSIGDALIVAALAAAFIGFYYFRHRERQRRLETVHQERMAAMDKGIPLPELPIDPPRTPRPPDPHTPLIMGIVWLALGGGAMISLALLPAAEKQMYWPLPLPLALLGVGFLLYYFLAKREG